MTPGSFKITKPGRRWIYEDLTNCKQACRCRACQCHRDFQLASVIYPASYEAMVAAGFEPLSGESLVAA